MNEEMKKRILQEAQAINPEVVSSTKGFKPGEVLVEVAKPFICLHGKARIVAVKTNALIKLMPYITFEVSFEELRGLLTESPYTSTFKKFCNDKFLEHVKNVNIENLRADLMTRRNLGGRKWEAQLLSEDDQVTCHLSREDIVTYHKKLVELTLQGQATGLFARENFENVLDELLKHL